MARPAADPFDKTVRIPLRVVNGTLEYFYGGVPPKLKEGVVCDLIVPAWAIEDSQFVKKLDHRQHVELLQKDSVVLVGVSDERTPEALKSSLITRDGLRTQGVQVLTNEGSFVSVKLIDALQLQLRGTKLGNLRPAKCRIDSIDKEAVSLNHAYRLISESFEPWRIAHSGNVFQKCFHLRGQNLLSLGRLRDEKEAEAEKYL